MTAVMTYTTLADNIEFNAQSSELPADALTSTWYTSPSVSAFVLYQHKSLPMRGGPYD